MVEMKNRRNLTRKQRGGGYFTSSQYFGDAPTFGNGAALSSEPSGEFIRPPMLAQRGGRRGHRQGGGAYGTSSQLYGDVPSYGSGAALSSAAAGNWIRPPLPAQRGGFSPSLMGPFSETAARMLPLAVAAVGYKTYKAYTDSAKRSSRRRSRRSRRSRR